MTINQNELWRVVNYLEEALLQIETALDVTENKDVNIYNSKAHKWIYNSISILKSKLDKEDKQDAQ